MGDPRPDLCGRALNLSGTDRRTVDLWGIETPSALMQRFSVDVLDVDVATATTTMAMPIAGLLNPFTGAPSVAPLAFLVDAVGVVNHFRRRDDEWTVSSELALELSPDAVELAACSDQPVVANAGPVGKRASSALAACTLSCGGARIGVGTVRAFYIRTDAALLEHRVDELVRTADTTLADLMAVCMQSRNESATVLGQRLDPTLNNAIGIVNGGIAAAGLELAASAAVDVSGAPMRTASLRVNFMRQFAAGGRSRYEATALRIGRGTAVADAKAITHDGTVGLVARLTACR